MSSEAETSLNICRAFGVQGRSFVRAGVCACLLANAFGVPSAFELHFVGQIFRDWLVRFPLIRPVACRLCRGLV